MALLKILCKTDKMRSSVRLQVINKNRQVGQIAHGTPCMGTMSKCIFFFFKVVRAFGKASCISHPMCQQRYKAIQNIKV